MAAKRVEVLEFRVEEPAAVVERMDRIGEAHRGWVNLRPSLPPEEEPPAPSPIGAIFSTEVHDVPVCTWVAGKAGRHQTEPDSLGVQHSAGTRTVAHLASIGLALPEGWRPVQDHPRRGLVVHPPVGTGHRDELEWLLMVGTALSKVRLRGDWYAEIHGGP